MMTVVQGRLEATTSQVCRWHDGHSFISAGLGGLDADHVLPSTTLYGRPSDRCHLESETCVGCTVVIWRINVHEPRLRMKPSKHAL